MPPERSLTTHGTEPVVAIVLDEDGQEVVRYFSEEEAEAATTDDVTHAALAAIGSCSDLDWEEWAEELDRIRHESRPTPPIDL